MSNKNNLRFETLGVSAFAGIGPTTKVDIIYPENFDISPELNGLDNDNGLVIVFPKGLNYIELEGNQGVGKTSLMECLKEATGSLSSSNTEHIQSGEDGMPVTDKKYKDRFWGVDGQLYNLRVTKSTITLEQISTDEEGNPVLNAKNKEISVQLKSPKTMLQQLIGPAGISPMLLKQMNPAEQVKWMRSLFTLDVDEQKMELEIKKKYDDAYKERTKTNNEYNRIETVLNSNKYYVAAEQWQTYFDKTDYDTLQESVADVQKRKQDYDKAVDAIPVMKSNLKIFESDIDVLEEQLKNIQARLDDKKELALALTKRISEGETYVESNKTVVDEIEQLSEKIKEASEFKAHEQGFDNMKKQKYDMDHQSDEKIRLNGLVDEYAKLKKEYIKQFTPDIPDFEVCIKDEGDNREGLYYKTLPLSILAESELWELATQIWKAMGVKIIYVENVNSLGSGAVDKFNEFLKSGGAYIFGTKMNRSENNLKISFHDKIPS